MVNRAFQLISSSGTRYSIREKGLSMGRHSDNDVVVPGTKVSRKHAHIILGVDRCWIRDENSGSGTFVNGQRVVGQQEIKPGDTIQIDQVTFKLVTTRGAGSASLSARRNQVVIWGVGAVLLILILMIGMNSSKMVNPFLQATETITESIAITLSPSETPEPSTTVPDPPSPSETPAYQASIACEDIGEQRDRRDCRVTNASPVQDVLWLSFEPYRDQELNDFNLTVLLPGRTKPFELDRKGMVSLGVFEPGETKTITLQMYCVNVNAGCRLTSVHVRLLVNDGQVAIVGADGEFDIQNAVQVAVTTPTNKPSTSGGTNPTHTNTPSDAIGPTSTAGAYP